jgi:ABC-2 type transport system permease protein
VPTSALVLAKFMAAWTLASLMLVLTTPLWLGLSLLGPVDHGATLTAYLGSCLLAGAYLAIGMAASAVSRSQVLSFVIALGVSFLATAAGLPLVSSTLAAFLPLPLTEALASLSMLDAFAGFERGVIEARELSYFLAVIALGLCLTGLWVDNKRWGQA